MDGIRTYGGGEDFARRLAGRRFLFSLVMSYTRTAQIPGITVAGSNPELLKFTPPADAEFIWYGRCRCIDSIPMTPDGKPTPALLTRAALRSSGIPFVAVDAGGMVKPRMPHIHTGLEPGGDISREAAMSEGMVGRAIEYGRAAGMMLARMADCLVIGESIPGGTTTAQAVMRGLGMDARSSSSMPDNPVSVKERAVGLALSRLHTGEIIPVLSQLADPVIPFISGMLLGAPGDTPVLLAGGTQMAAVLAAARALGYGGKNAAIGTTRYILDDSTANLLDIAGAPVIAVDPGLGGSRYDGLRAYARGFAKEGAGGGGSMIAAMLGGGAPDAARMLRLVEEEYSRAVALGSAA